MESWQVGPGSPLSIQRLRVCVRTSTAPSMLRAVVGIADALKGQVPIGLEVLKAGVTRPASAIENECLALIRERLGALASLRAAMVVLRLPKTRSGKILCSTMRKIADREVQDSCDHRRPAILDASPRAEAKRIGA